MGDVVVTGRLRRGSDVVEFDFLVAQGYDVVAAAALTRVVAKMAQSCTRMQVSWLYNDVQDA
jgi:hypothetical protein